MENESDHISLDPTSENVVLKTLKCHIVDECEFFENFEQNKFIGSDSKSIANQ